MGLVNLEFGNLWSRFELEALAGLLGCFSQLGVLPTFQACIFIDGRAKLLLSHESPARQEPRPPEIASNFIFESGTAR